MKNLNQSLIKFHVELRPINKDAQNPFFKSDYLTLSGILDTVRPILAKHGMAVMQLMKVDSGNTILITRLIHESGEMFDSEMILPGHSDPQKFGSLITYYKRYSLQAMLGISTKDEDDDGNLVSHPIDNQAQKKSFDRPAITPASEAQKNALTKMGIYFSNDISKSEASKLIESANKKKG